MSRKKTICGAALGILMSSGPTLAVPATTVERLKVFAECAGRNSALEEQQRLFDGPASEKTAARVQEIESLIEALLPLAQATGTTGRDVLNWRVDAKMAQAVLLQQATFSLNTERARTARQMAQAHLNTCANLFLGA